ncbi:MAG: DEAD/DEAH box helicase [Clostridiales bacterium]|nr:DEAD/DEAH box helicase [Clostridiales bacterium]
MNRAKDSLRKHKMAPLLVLPCGAGKSVLAADIAKTTTSRGKRVLFIEQRDELCLQITNTFVNYGVDMELCDIGMVQSLGNRLATIEPPTLIIVDEAHHSVCKSYMKIFKAFPKAWRLGLTATPQRLDGKPMKPVFDDLIVGVSTKKLIEDNYLAQYRIYSLELADLSDIKVVRGEYEMGSRFENKKIYGDTVGAYKKLAEGRKAIAFCSTVKAAEDTAEEFRLRGYSAVALSGNTPLNERRRTMEMFRSGEVMVICNCGLFGEGIDVPDCSCVIMLRKTKSLALYVQQSMRAMRFMPGKIAIIIDHVTNCFEHGFPDEDREWSLEGKKKKEAKAPQLKTCPECSAVYPLGVRVCEDCGYEFYEEPEKEEPEREYVELKEVTQEMMARCRQLPYDHYKKLTSFEELENFRISRGMKQFWTYFKMLELKITEIPIQHKRNFERARFIQAQQELERQALASNP